MGASEVGGQAARDQDRPQPVVPEDQHGRWPRREIRPVGETARGRGDLCVHADRGRIEGVTRTRSLRGPTTHARGIGEPGIAPLEPSPACGRGLGEGFASSKTRSWQQSAESIRMHARFDAMPPTPNAACGITCAIVGSAVSSSSSRRRSADALRTSHAWSAASSLKLMADNTGTSSTPTEQDI